MRQFLIPDTRETECGHKHRRARHFRGKTAIDGRRGGAYNNRMKSLSEPEKNLYHNLDQALEALPSLARWLRRFAPGRPQGDKVPTLAQVRVLIHLFQNGHQSMGQLARGLGVSCSAATECVAALEATGKVTRTRSSTDRRRVEVTLSHEAQAVAARVISERRVVLERVLDGLTDREGRAFVKGLVFLGKNAETWLDEARFRQEVEDQAAPRLKESANAQ
ncbi:MAG: MarR family transcriptional regulator [Dehalococcoidia bacterium]|nr:MarR family transcriptional regulator [Dehalococcoidia bacterium]